MPEKFPSCILAASLFAALFGVANASAGTPKESAWSPVRLWQDKNPLFTEKGSRNFESDGPFLRSIRVSKRALGTGETCAAAFAKVQAHPLGEPYVAGSAQRFAGWGPWTDDLDAVEKCDSFPCKIKFNEAETKAIAAKPKEARLAETLRQIDARIAGYVADSRRRGYDRPEDSRDPWATFVIQGHVMPEAFAASKPVFVARKLPFGDGSYRALRQIFDVRTFDSKNRFVRVARDIYTSHYFDGWGEWLEVRCIPERREVLVLQDLLIEFDLLKKTDILSVIARPKMRQGVDQESLKVQKAMADAIAE